MRYEVAWLHLFDIHLISIDAYIYHFSFISEIPSFLNYIVSFISCIWWGVWVLIWIGDGEEDEGGEGRRDIY